MQENPWDKVKEQFPVGHVFEGTVSNVTDFGIFVNIMADIDGMVHINDLSWEKATEADLAKYKKGDKIQVKVLEIDTEKGRVALGVKQLTESPYGNAEIDVKKGTVVTCVITAIADDGIEVALSNGMNGFIKKGDLAKDREDRRTDRFAVGEKVDAKIINIDKSGRKIGLSIKSLEIDEEKSAMVEFGSSDSGASLGDILGLAIKNGKNEK